MTRKSIRQGLLDIALLTTNASKLKHAIDWVVQNGGFDSENGIALIGLIVSMLLQVTA